MLWSGCRGLSPLIPFQSLLQPLISRLCWPSATLVLTNLPSCSSLPYRPIFLSYCILPFFLLNFSSSSSESLGNRSDTISHQPQDTRNINSFKNKGCSANCDDVKDVVCMTDALNCNKTEAQLDNKKRE